MVIETQKRMSERPTPVPMGWTDKEYKQYNDLLVKANVGQLQYIYKDLARVIEQRLKQEELKRAY